MITRQKSGSLTESDFASISLTADRVLTAADPKVLIVTPNASGWKLYLDESLFERIVVNASAEYSFLIHQPNTGALLATIPEGMNSPVALLRNPATNLWLA